MRDFIQESYPQKWLVWGGGSEVIYDLSADIIQADNKIGLNHIHK